MSAEDVVEPHAPSQTPRAAPVLAQSPLRSPARHVHPGGENGLIVRGAGSPNALPARVAIPAVQHSNVEKLSMKPPLQGGPEPVRRRGAWRPLSVPQYARREPRKPQ